MTQPEKTSTYKTQKAVKPAVEDIINATLQGEKKRGALEFAAFLQTVKMKPQWASGNSWTLSYKSKRVGYVKINDSTGDWELRVYNQYDPPFNELLAKESAEIQNFIMGNIKPCYKCGSLAPGVDAELLGKKMQFVCAIPVVFMTNPDAQFRAFAERLVVLRRDAIANNRVPNCWYVKMSARK